MCDYLYFLVGEKIIIKTQDLESLDQSMLISKTLVCDPRLCSRGGAVGSFLGCLSSTFRVPGPFWELGIVWR